MAINVPQSVFDKYFEVIDSTFTIFGVTCQLVFIETVEEISTSFDNFPTHNSVNAHRRGGGNPGFEREDKVFKEVEKTEDIVLKVYWDARSWVKTGSDIVVPDGSIQTIGKMTDLEIGCQQDLSRISTLLAFGKEYNENKRNTQRNN